MMLLTDLFLIADPFGPVVSEITSGANSAKPLIRTIILIIYAGWFVYCGYGVVINNDVKGGMLKIIVGAIFVTIIDQIVQLTNF